MKYEDAIKVWGAQKLRQSYAYRNRAGSAPEVNVDAVTVQMDFDEGFDCCGGSEGCYCSLAYPASANVVISDYNYAVSIDHNEFEFATILKEVVAAADGVITM